MIITKSGEGLNPVRLGDGRTVWLTQAELKRAKAHQRRSPGALVDVVKIMTEIEAEDREDTHRRYVAVRMAVSGEFSGLMRQLQLWGIEAVR